MESILETKASTLLEFFAGLRGSLFVTFEEGTSAAWLYDLLKPHVTDVLVRVLSSSELSIRLGIKTSSRAPVPWQAEHDNQPRDCAVRVEPCMSRLLYRVNTK